MKKNKSEKQPSYTLQEEIANTTTHALGILLGVVAGGVLIYKSMNSALEYSTITVLIYLFGMLFSYVSSTTYHALKPGETKAFLRKFDHAAIYVHIAGTYTPFTILVLRDYGMWGYGLFAFVWLVAILGVILSFIRLKEHSHLETVCYVLMGCCCVLAFKTLWTALSAINPLSFYMLMGGGLAFVLGALLYSLHKTKYAHSIFHIFCLLGSIGHIIAIYCVL